MLSKMIRPHFTLEIGTYLGYSALCFAKSLADGGKIITLDVNEETNKVAPLIRCKDEVRRPHRFSTRPQRLTIIPTLDETIDLGFIDADKPNYSNYYKLVFDKLRPGGFIIADNVLWSGKVLESEKDENTEALHAFNEMVLADKRVTNVLLPIRDGLMVVCKE